MNYQRTERIRRAAILVASLEEAMAQQMLDSMPYDEAAKILAEVERLDEIDADEQQDVLDEFKRLSRRTRETEAVEFTYSAPQPVHADGTIHETHVAPAVSASAAGAKTEPIDPLAAAEVSTIVALLVEEHPQTIAAALSRLGEEQAADVFAALPGRLQTEVLDRLARLEIADEEAINEIHRQLILKIEQQRAQRERAAAGIALARRVLAKTTPTLQATLLGRLPGSSGGQHNRAGVSVEQEFAEEARSGGATWAGQQYSAEQHREFARDDADRARPFTAGEGAFGAELDAAVGGVEWRAGTSQGEIDPVDRSGELEPLPDKLLLAALQQADQQTIQRALAASSETLVKRIAARLPRRQANQLRKMLRSLGPTRLADLRKAQLQILKFAEVIQNGATSAAA